MSEPSLKPVLILGASSSIARGVAYAFAKRGYPLILAGRDAENLERLGKDIEVRFGVKVKSASFDALAEEGHALLLRHVVALMGGLSGAVLAFGDDALKQEAKYDFEAASKLIRVNYTGAVSILTYLAQFFEAQESGFIAAISSVAGERGRESNYVYGSAKAALSTYMQGLRHRLAMKGVTVLTVKPGFVDTALTFGQPGLFLVADPKDVGEKIVRAIEKKKSEVYIPGFWRAIMWTIRNIPNAIFNRMSL